MSALGRGCGELHAGRAAADHQQAHGRRSSTDRRLALTAGAGIGAAAKAQSFERVPVDAVVERDAGAHVLRLPCKILGEP